jgi:hypothetical protein
MSDKTKDATQDAEITISSPDEITMGVWRAYSKARKAYIDKMERDGQDAFDLEADYAGALAVIERGYFHVKGPDDITSLLKEKDWDKIPASFIGAIVFYVAAPIRRATLDPLQDQPRWAVKLSKNGSAPTS